VHLPCRFDIAHVIGVGHFDVPVTRVAKSDGDEPVCRLTRVHHSHAQRRQLVDSRVVQAEVSGAHMLTRNDDLHDALNRVIRATLGAPAAEMAVRGPVINQGRLPTPDPIPGAMSAMQTAVGNARQMAGDLLDTGWE
jgi:hypothetical protein